MTCTYFQTASLNMVAWLITKGFNIKDTKKLDGQTIFYFDRNEEVQKAVNDYNSNYELKKFISNFRKVKEIAKS